MCVTVCVVFFVLSLDVAGGRSRLQAQYSSRESGVEALVAAPQVVRRHTLNRKQLVFQAQYVALFLADILR